jgi:hypothetical protein
MIDDKLMQKMRDGLEFALEGLKKIQASNEKPKPEPQAGDVWASPFETIFIHKLRGATGLGFTYITGYTGTLALKEILKNYPFKRIFSLTEHLKNKEAEDE